MRVKSDKKKKSLPRRILRKAAYYAVLAIFYIPSRFGKKMTEIPDTCDEEPLVRAFEEKHGGRCKNVEFQEPGTGLRLRGMYLPADAERRDKCTVVFCHGLGGTKAQLMPVADYVHSLGHDAFLFDMRGHGDSEGDFTSLGYFEAKDTLAACQHMRERHGADRIVLYGFSMGAVAAAMAAQDDSVVGLVAESPFDSLENIVAHKAREHYHVPKWPVVTLSLWATEVRRNFDRRDVDLTKVLPRLEGKRVLLVASTGDTTIPAHITRRLTPYLRDGHNYWEVDGVEHGGIFESEFEPEYRARLRSFLVACGDASPRPAGSKGADVCPACPACPDVGGDKRRVE